MDDLKSQGKSALIWDLSGKMATQGVAFAVSVFLARLLDPSEFGLIAIVMVIVGIANVFTDAGLNIALIQRKKTLAIHYASVFYFNVSTGIILTVITYLSAESIGDYYDNAALVPLLQVMSLSFVISALSSVQTAKLKKELNYSAIAKVSFQASLIGGLLGVSLAFKGAGPWSLVAQILSMSIAYCILIWRASKWVPTPVFSFKALKQLWGFGFRMFLSALLDALFTRMDFLIIGKLFPVSTLGYYQRAKSLNSMIVNYSSSSLASVLLPALSKIKSDLLRYQAAVQEILRIITFILFPLLGTVYLVSEELIVFIFGEKWLPSVAYFRILVISGFTYPIGVLLVNVLASRGNSKGFLRLEIYKKLLMSINFVVLFYLGISAYLIGLVVISILSAWLNMAFAATEIKLPIICFLKPVVIQASISIVGVLAALSLVAFLGVGVGLSLLVKTFSFMAIYLIVSFIFKTDSYRSFVAHVIPLVRISAWR